LLASIRRNLAGISGSDLQKRRARTGVRRHPQVRSQQQQYRQRQRNRVEAERRSVETTEDADSPSRQGREDSAVQRRIRGGAEGIRQAIGGGTGGAGALA